MIFFEVLAALILAPIAFAFLGLLVKMWDEHHSVHFKVKGRKAAGLKPIPGHPEWD